MTPSLFFFLNFSLTAAVSIFFFKSILKDEIWPLGCLASLFNPGACDQTGNPSSMISSSELNTRTHKNTQRTLSFGSLSKRIDFNLSGVDFQEQIIEPLNLVCSLQGPQRNRNHLAVELRAVAAIKRRSAFHHLNSC